LVANLLYINQFPDAGADGLAGKRTVVVRLGRTRAAAGYLILALTSHLILVAGVALGTLPAASLAGLLALAPALKAFALLRRHAENPAQLRPAIGTTIAAAHIHGLAVAIALFIVKVMS
jgi:1,4-dihydroxy-2-naphthoate octaprenyltransferase